MMDKMRSMLAGVGLVLALATAAGATGQQLEMDFVCVMTREVPAEKNDPLMYTRVHLDARCPRLRMTVEHTTRRSVADRGAQYVTTTECAGPFEFNWSGTYAKDHSMTMSGSLYLGGDARWHYDELLYNRGKPWYRSWTVCEVVSE